MAGETVTSELVVFDLESKDVVARLPATGFPAFFNELTISKEGVVYISDTLGPRVWYAMPELASVEVFVEDPLLANPTRPFGQNGIALTNDETKLVVSVMDRIVQGDGTLVTINTETREVANVALSGDVVASFGGSDGMFFAADGTLVMTNVTPNPTIITATFSTDFSNAQLVARSAF